MVTRLPQRKVVREGSGSGGSEPVVPDRADGFGDAQKSPLFYLNTYMSDQRKKNTRELILETLETVFRKNGIPRDFKLRVAERDEASPALRIAE